jgi:hypothetical protein
MNVEDLHDAGAVPDDAAENRSIFSLVFAPCCVEDARMWSIVAIKPGQLGA